MNSVDEALAFAESLLSPDRLSAVQELVFRHCWLGDSYREIAEGAGYEPDYLRSVGARLWQQLSEILGERVTKNNVRAVLRQRSRQQDDRPDPSARNPTRIRVELPEGVVPLDSEFYLERPLLEAKAFEEIARAGALLRIKAPRWMGKTSLMIRILAAAEGQGCHIARLNFEQADRAVLGNIDRFLRWFCANLSLQLHLDAKLDDYWDEDLGSKVSCTSYLQGHILGSLAGPVAIALDEVNRLFEYPEVAQEFLPMLRFWHEEGKNLPLWSRLRWIVVHATNAYVPLNINQSPFNVGVALALPEFDRKRVVELAHRHQLDWFTTETSTPATDKLMALVGGHPYLVRVALYALASSDIELETLLQEATTQTGIYRDHLQGHLLTLQAQPELALAFKQVLEASQPVRLPAIAAYQLFSTGLIVLQGDDASVRCELYRRYFWERLDEFCP